MSQTPPYSLKSIQMIGTQRSGSNLLRVMLNQLSEIYAPHPPHILHTFYPLLTYYGDLSDDKIFATLIDDVCTYIELNPVPWEPIHLKRAEIFKLCNRRTLLELFIRINELQCSQNDKSIWCCKSLETVYYLNNFDKENFRPFVIYLVRDGRDVAVSFRKAMVGEKHIYNLAVKWKDEQDLAMKYLEKISPVNFIVIRYEEFILDPATFIKEICLKVGIKYNASVMAYYKSQESHRTAESGKMWENVTKPVIKNNTGKFISELTHFDLQVFETIAGSMLEKLGYKRTIHTSEELTFSKEEINRFNEENKQLKKLAVTSADEHDIQKRKPQKDFLEKLKERLKINQALH